MLQGQYLIEKANPYKKILGICINNDPNDHLVKGMN